ncbi:MULTISPECIES: sulfur oxidation c-type cytochrome SoxA [unclassified Beijerinckia]|uniref:sulfur oxidation c-type cytochrome SoxA n=1 Tax=unclassified Beijerinckia TaxID=2638183 RepID=UPI000897F54E|nr:MULTISPECIES: sulfur oxidation c-type cytochrome SoxA [unclassified Beijerinckia]MDH7794370.1 sulfur-oxidizing protein SoxA [Beijerinckia sp. GAS462]SEB60199.1 diheme cytochrome SoxA (sulfur oxidation) [Beijerinckia sp. 28-YEA-48]
MKAALVFSLVLASTVLALAAEIAPSERKSGFEFMGRDTQAMQQDDTSNPGMLSVLDGGALWDRPDGADKKACASCHGDASRSMEGVAARYPAFDPAVGKVIDLEQRINLCRSDHQKAPAFAYESPDLLALSAFVARQSRGLPIAIASDARNAEALAEGRKLFTARVGQLNLSCAICHDDNWGQKLGGTSIPQGHPNGYPLYRLEWQAMGSLQRRLRNCMIGMRAEPYSYGSTEFVALELFLMQRAQGIAMESPAVRP